jgi:hypothetical protein
MFVDNPGAECVAEKISHTMIFDYPSHEFRERKVLFTANDLILEGISILQNKSPQQYFPTCMKAEIIEHLSHRKNVLVNPTGVDLSTLSSLSPSSKLVSVPSNDFTTVTKTLEGYVLPLLPQAPIFIHNLHFKIQITSECYLELDLPYYDKNNGKHHSENIGTSNVDYVLYPSGTVDIHVRCSNNPFRLETEIDRSRINAFFGQIRDRLILAEIMDWQVTECDINKDIKVSHLLHFSAIKVQVKYLDYLFRIYIKAMGKDTVYRIEERKHPHKPPLDFINDVFNPLEKVEKLLSEFRDEQKSEFRISEDY